MAAVTVESDAGKPARLIWNGKRCQIQEVVDCWREQGRWWEREEEGEFFLVLTAQGLLMLMHPLARNEWYVKAVR